MEYINDINKEVVRFNENDDREMTIRFLGESSILFLDGKRLTSDLNIYVLQRIKQINREHGYNFL